MRPAAKDETVFLGDPRNPHPEARITEPVVRLPDDCAIKENCERILSAAERRRFRFLHTEARRNGAGVRTAIRLALRRQIAEGTKRLEAALREAR